jgi:REP element-mobilizing transposase RayT
MFMHHYHGNKLRKGRFSETGRGYLVTAVTNERKAVFHDWTLARLLVAELRQASETGLVESLAWVIMPDHVHWLIILQEATLAAVIQRVKSRSAIRINKQKGTVGRFWQKGFHDRAVRRDEDIRIIARYIVANPLRAGITEDIGAYPLWDAAWL